MARDKSKTPDDENGAPIKKSRKFASEPESDTRSESDDGSKRSERSRHSKRTRSKRKRSRSSSRKPRGDGEEDSYTLSSSESESESESDSYSDSESGGSEEYSESEDERRRRKRREKRKREEKEKERRRRKEKEKKRRIKDREEKEERRRKKKKEKKKKKKDKEKGKPGAVTNLWGKYGIIRETDMWNKRPEFTAWLAEVKQVNLESLSNWEEKQMFKAFMEDHNTATFPSKKYYDLDAYHRRQMEKEMKRGSKIRVAERTVFNDEEQRRQEMLQERERQKEAEIEGLKRSMQSGMAQAMKEQAQLKEEMAYQYKIGNFEAAAAIQRRLDPDVAM